MKLHDLINKNLREIPTKHCSNNRSNSNWFEERRGKVLALTNQALRILSKTTNEILKKRPEVNQKYSSSFIKEKLIDIVFNFYTNTPLFPKTKLLPEIKKFLRSLNQPSEELAFLVPIVNLKFVGFGKLSIGIVHLYALNLKSLNNLNKKFRMRLGSQKRANERLSYFIKNNINVLAVVSVNANDIKKAENIALSQVEASLNILRLYDNYRQIGIQRNFVKNFHLEDIYHIGKSDKRIGSSHRAQPNYRFFPYVLDQSKLKLLKKKGNFDRFRKLLKQDQSNKFANKMLMSIHWYGLAVKDTNPVDKFVKLIISLECLLVGKNQLIKHSISDKIAFILGKDKDSRKELYDISTKMYSIRSEIVHDGRDFISEEDISTLMVLVKTLIFTLIRYSSRLKNISDIDERIREIKFGSNLRGI